MANHLRQQIRERVGVDLAGLTTTGGRVYQSRLFDIQEHELPCLLIYTTSEASEFDTIGSATRGIRRQVELIVEGFAKGRHVDDTLDTISKEVEEALQADITLNGLAYDIGAPQTEIEFSDEGSQGAGRVRLSFIVEYRTTEGTATAAS